MFKNINFIYCNLYPIIFLLFNKLTILEYALNFNRYYNKNLHLHFYLVCPRISTDEIYISPFIYDVQNNYDTVIYIKGLTTTIDTIQMMKCNVMDLDSRTIMVISLMLLICYKLY